MGAASQINPLLKFEIEVVKGPHQGLKLSFQKEAISIGRGIDNDVVLSEDLRISRQHVEVIQSHGQFKFKNANTKNYTLYNGAKLESGPLSSKDVLTVGESEVVFRQVLSPALTQSNTLLTSAALQRPKLQSMPPPQRQPLPQQPLQPQPQQHSRPHHQQAPPNFRQGAGPRQNDQNGKLRFYLILAAVGVALYFFVFQGSGGAKKQKKIRGGEEIELAVQQSEENIKNLEERLGERNTVTNKRAEENFVKGFRDYQKGQYLRSREYFQIVLNLSPEHVEARKYYELSKIKFDKQIDYNFIEGLKNKDKKNYRMCRSHFSQVLILIQNDRMHPKYDETQRYLRECSLSLERRF